MWWCIRSARRCACACTDACVVMLPWRQLPSCWQDTWPVASRGCVRPMPLALLCTVLHSGTATTPRCVCWTSCGASSGWYVMATLLSAHPPVRSVSCCGALADGQTVPHHVIDLPRCGCAWRHNCAHHRRLASHAQHLRLLAVGAARFHDCVWRQRPGKLPLCAAENFAAAATTTTTTTTTAGDAASGVATCGSFLVPAYRRCDTGLLVCQCVQSVLCVRQRLWFFRYLLVRSEKRAPFQIIENIWESVRVWPTGREVFCYWIRMISGRQLEQYVGEVDEVRSTFPLAHPLPSLASMWLLLTVSVCCGRGVRLCMPRMTRCCRLGRWTWAPTVSLTRSA